MNLRLKTRGNNETIIFSWWKQLIKETISCTIVTLLLPYLLTFATLIVAVCRTLVIYELRNGPRPTKSLCVSVVEHRSAESESLRFDFSWELGIFSLSHARDKTKKNIFLYFFSELKTLPSFLFYSLPCGCVPNNLAQKV